MEEAYIHFPGPIIHLHLQGQEGQIRKKSIWGQQEENKLHYTPIHIFLFVVFAVTL